MSQKNEQKLDHLAEFFKIFGDSTRIRIIQALHQKKQCVHELAELLNISQSAASHQLRTLRQHRLVKYEKQGKHVFYELDDKHVSAIFQMGLKHISE